MIAYEQNHIKHRPPSLLSPTTIASLAIPFIVSCSNGPLLCLSSLCVRRILSLSAASLHGATQSADAKFTLFGCATDVLVLRAHREYARLRIAGLSERVGSFVNGVRGVFFGPSSSVTCLQRLDLQ